MPSFPAADFSAVFASLRDLLTPYGALLDCKADTPGVYHLDTRHIMPNRKPLFFGAVQIKKHYVSYHLMPIYTHTRLLDRISPDLQRRRQGKSCFNFKTVDEPLLAELAELTRMGFDTYRRDGFV
ncbi:MAG: hypothetical protein U0821_00540 [Chloroflexota bacterium]